MSLFFIHGGPGFNSQPDRLVLSNPLTQQGIKTTFWDEPSSLRPHGSPFFLEGAYAHWLSDLHAALHRAKPQLVVASSFGARGLTDLVRLHPGLNLPQILMLGPTLDMNAVFKRMMEISEKDLLSSSPDISERLQVCREESQSFWDPLMQEGLGLVWQNPNLLSHYFRNKDTLALWAGVGSDPLFGIDMQSQVAVLNNMSQMHFPQLMKPVSTPVYVLAGSSDPVFNRAEAEKELKPVFQYIQFEQWQDCGHFPQMEKPDEFIKLAKKLIG